MRTAKWISTRRRVMKQDLTDVDAGLAQLCKFFHRIDLGA